MTNPSPTPNQDELSAIVSEKLSEYSLHPQETHGEDCVFWEDETNCDCSHEFEFKQYPKFMADLTTALRSYIDRTVAERLLAIIGEDEASEEIREFRCPLYNECFQSEDYYAVTKGGHEFCNVHGRKLQLYQAKQPQGDEWVRNELRAELRTAAQQQSKEQQ